MKLSNTDTIRWGVDPEHDGGFWYENEQSHKFMFCTFNYYFLIIVFPCSLRRRQCYAPPSLHSKSRVSTISWDCVMDAFCSPARADAVCRRVCYRSSGDPRKCRCCLRWTTRNWRKTWSEARVDSSPCCFKLCAGLVYFHLFLYSSCFFFF